MDHSQSKLDKGVAQLHWPTVLLKSYKTRLSPVYFVISPQVFYALIVEDDRQIACCKSASGNVYHSVRPFVRDNGLLSLGYKDEIVYGSVETRHMLTDTGK
jgi:hypothetical protein